MPRSLSSILPSRLPNILIVADNVAERDTIAALVEEAGVTAVMAGDDAVAMLRQTGIAGAVVALPERAMRDFLDRAAVRAPHAKLLVVCDAHAMAVEDGRVSVAHRPLDPRELIGGVIDLMLREDPHNAAPRHGLAAELGIATAKLACLCRREASAASVGAGRLMHDMAAQIADMRAGLAAPMMAAGDD
jgi:CheY-like chemotaxis protein